MMDSGVRIQWTVREWEQIWQIVSLTRLRIKTEGRYFSNMSVAFEQMFADMTSSPEVANQLISALRDNGGSSDSPAVAAELIAALRSADRTGQSSPAVARELLAALEADRANLLPSAASDVVGAGSEVGIQTEDRTPRETRQTQVRVTQPCGQTGMKHCAEIQGDSGGRCL